MTTATNSTKQTRRGNIGRLFTGVALFFLAGFFLLAAPLRIDSLFDPVLRERRAFHDEQIEPIVKKYHARDQEELRRVLLRAESLFLGYGKGVELFVDDMTTMSTRFKMAGRFIAETYDSLLGRKDSGQVAEYVAHSFQKLVVSPQRLERDLLALVSELAYALEANQNLMLTEIRETVNESDLFLDAEAFQAAHFQELIRLKAPQFRKMGLSSASLVVADMAGLAIAAACTPGGPVWVAVGIVAGLAVDWLASAKVKADLRDAGLKIITDMREAVIDDSRTGLRVVLNRSLEDLHRVRAKVVAETITLS